MSDVAELDEVRTVLRQAVASGEVTYGELVALVLGLAATDVPAPKRAGFVALPRTIMLSDPYPPDSYAKSSGQEPCQVHADQAVVTPLQP